MFQTPAIAIKQPHSSPSAAAAGSAPQFTQTGRFRQQRIRSVDFANGDFLKRDSKKNEGTDENFDEHLKDDLMFDDSNHEEVNTETVDDLDDDSGMYMISFISLYKKGHFFPGQFLILYRVLVR